MPARAAKARQLDTLVVMITPVERFERRRVRDHTVDRITVDFRPEQRPGLAIRCDHAATGGDHRGLVQSLEQCMGVGEEFGHARPN